jgi:3-methyladenine DNA glycosylase AlkD
MSPKAASLLSIVRAELEEAADPAKAPQMKAYMKSEMPYHGVQSPLVKDICRRVFAGHDFSDGTKWEKDVLALWRGAKFREERYVALSLATHRRARDHHVPKTLPMYEEIIVDGAWWDYVDWASSKGVGAILRAHPAKMKPLMLKWSKCDNMWKRRTSIICQLDFGEETDLDLLYACIEPSMDSKEFFLRKAIGWALRQYAWTDPKEIVRYVKRNEARLSPLSKREALKNIGR